MAAIEAADKNRKRVQGEVIPVTVRNMDPDLMISSRGETTARGAAMSRVDAAALAGET
jgi:hypothetical protein